MLTHTLVTWHSQPNLALVAENGCYLRLGEGETWKSHLTPGLQVADQAWVSLVVAADFGWKKMALPILQQYQVCALACEGVGFASKSSRPSVGAPRGGRRLWVEEDGATYSAAGPGVCARVCLVYGPMEGGLKMLGISRVLGNLSRSCSLRIHLLYNLYCSASDPALPDAGQLDSGLSAYSHHIYTVHPTGEHRRQH